MLEAVNSTLSNAPLIRGNAEQNSSARSLSANPEKIQQVAQAPFISPYIHMDMNYDKAVLALRDSETGDFLVTIPSDARLQAQAQDAQRRARTELQVTSYIRSEPQQTAQPVVEAPEAPQVATPAPSAAAFGAFAKQVASMQTAAVGSTVSTFA